MSLGLGGPTEGPSAVEPATVDPAPEKAVPEETPKKDPPILLKPEELVLEGPTGEPIHIKIKTTIGKSTLTQFGEDAQFWSEPQFTLIPVDAATGRWAVLHDDKAQNETLLNGKAVKGSEPLKDGDVLAVGREARGLIKLPLTVRIGK
jgi:hypothetical protein